MPLPGMNCATSTAPDHPDLKVVKYRGIYPKLRKTFFIAGLSPEINFATYNNSIAAAECAVKERVFFVQDADGVYTAPPLPHPTSFTTGMQGFFVEFKKHVKFFNPMTTEQFALSYQAQNKRLRYLKASLSLKMKPYSIKDSFVKLFLKFEKYNFKRGKKVVPRVISPRGDRYTVALGRFIKTIEKFIYKIFNTKLFNTPVILKCYNQEQRGSIIHQKWMKFTNPCAISIDAKRFDQHVSEAALRFEHSVYKMFYPYSKELALLLSHQINNKHFCNMLDGSIYYKTKAGRKSGDVNTALGNCIISSASLFVLKQTTGIDFEFVNDGDDSVIICEKKDEPILREAIPGFFLSLGFTMDVEPTVYELEQIKFCQCQPIFDGHKYIMVRDPRISLTKDCLSLKPLDNPKVSKMWLSSVGQCGLSLTAGIPVVQSFYNCLVRASDGAKMLRDPTMDDWYHYVGKGLMRTDQTIVPKTRYSFWLAFGICPEEQLSIEALYDSTTIDTDVKPYRSKHIMLPI